MSKSHQLFHFIRIALPPTQTEIDADQTKAKAQILRVLREVTAEANGQ
jgi:hypothetical protein